jgi:hypothetical protein
MHVRDPLTHWEGPRLSTELHNRELDPCEGFLARGSNEDQGKRELLDTSVKILESSTGVCISIVFLPSAFILCTLVVCLLS